MEANVEVRNKPIPQELLELLQRFLRKEDYEKWLSSPHPDLGNMTPQQCINQGRGDAVETMISNALSGLPS